MYNYRIDFYLDNDNGNLEEGFMLTLKLTIPGYGNSTYETGYKIQSGNWDASFNSVTGEGSEVANNFVENLELGVKTVLLYESRLGELFLSAEVVLDKYKAWVNGTQLKREEEYKPVTFKDAWEEMMVLENFEKGCSTYRGYRGAMRILDKFLLSHHEMGIDEYHVQKITLADVTRLESYMRTTGNLLSKKILEPKSVQLYLKKLQAVIRWCVKMNYLKTHPFPSWTPTRLKKGFEQTDLGPKVTPAEMKKIKNFKGFDDPKMKDLVNRRTRWLILFQWRTGMSYIDMKQFDADKHIKPVNKGPGKNPLFIVYRRQKTKVEAFIPFSYELKQLMIEMDWVTNVPEERVLKKNFVRCFEAMEMPDMITKNVTSHDFRKAFGQTMLNSGHSMETVSRMMGHSTVSQTEKIYAKIDQITILEDIERNNIKSEIVEVDNTEDIINQILNK